MAACDLATPKRRAAKRPAEQLTPEKTTRQRLQQSEGISEPKSPKSLQAAPTSLTPAEMMLGEALDEAYPLVSREHECGVLDQFLEASLKTRAGKCLYLSGGPGTGKTSVARGAAKAWRKDHADTRVLEINCMDNLRPCSVPGFLLKVTQACSQVTGLKGPALSSKSPLSSLVASAVSSLRSLGSSVILIVDEVDQLVQKWNAGDKSLEILCGLPKQSGAPALAIVMIANHVDLMVQACGPRWKSVCSSLLFERYSLQQLKTIVQSRFAGSRDGELAEKALGGRVKLELRIRRIANAGDCRHIVRLCEEGLASAIELRQAEDRAPTDVGEAGTTASQGSTPPTTCKVLGTQTSIDPLDSLKSLPLQQQILLCILSRRDEPMSTSDIFQKYLSCMSELKQPPASKPQVISALSCLEARGVLGLQKPRRGKGGKGKGRGKGKTEEQVVVLEVRRETLNEALQESARVLLGLRCLELERAPK
ncbi:Cdc6 [Symbiodinium natans]|uniref:Cdc6 protein n=1 Tax=Symbiodinium natans TaxID=878477 RepID=A0A812RRU0_9DINO|nr:Cdc6 [Symbiodinium natans]